MWNIQGYHTYTYGVFQQDQWLILPTPTHIGFTVSMPHPMLPTATVI
jgi:hypothetical protein